MSEDDLTEYAANIGRFVDQYFEQMDEDYLRVKDNLADIDKPVILSNKVIVLLVEEYVTFLTPILSALMKRALTNAALYPNEVRKFQIAPVKNMAFTVKTERIGSQA